MADKPVDALAVIASEQRARLKKLAINARSAKAKAEDLLSFMNAKLAHPEDHGKILEPEFLKRAKGLADAATEAHIVAFSIRAAQHTADHIASNREEGSKA